MTVEWAEVRIRRPKGGIAKALKGVRPLGPFTKIVLKEEGGHTNLRRVEIALKEGTSFGWSFGGLAGAITTARLAPAYRKFLQREIACR